MKLRHSSLAAIAAMVAFTLFNTEGSAALAEPTQVQAPAPIHLTLETVPAEAAPSFVANEVVQPLPDKADPQAIADNADSLSELVAEMPEQGALSREMECLAGAVYFESRGEPLAGQLEVAQVVINRSQSGAFPTDYCGVVYQPAQFSFVRHGRMPRINRDSAAWTRAVAVARIAHEGLWDAKAPDALYFHARSCNPSWSHTKIALTTIDSHIFYR